MERYEMKDHGGLAGESQSYWVASTPETGYPPLTETTAADVAVIGGGIVGVTAAALLRQEGYSVALLEGDRVGHGVTGHTTAKITSLHILIYAYLVNTFGWEKAQQYAEANQAAIDMIDDLVDRHGIECDFTRLPFFTFAATDKGRRQVEAEAKAARALGLPASYVDSIPLDIPCKGAIRFGGQAQFHPRKYLLGLAETIPGDGSSIFESTRVVEITEGDPCVVRAREGTVRADRVIVATHYPIAGLQGFYFARLQQERHYALALETERSFPKGMFIGAEKNSYSYRATESDEGELIIISGGPHHKTGQAEDTRSYYEKLAAGALQAYPLGRIRYHWATQGAFSVDEVPYIGSLIPGSRRLYTATGFGAWGMSLGTAAAMILSDLIQTGSNPWAPVFDPERFTPGASARRFLKENVDVAKAYISGSRSVELGEIESLGRGDGKVIEGEDQKVAVFKDGEERLYAVNGTCRHLGCGLRFNQAEKSWDCPCHGSRYAPDGTVLHAPTMEDLPRVDVDSGED
jgi:glycine/D-amino acid oxidase-like deaminating enzyme/nitrite reductase/ring-hydroxylating ferredoxin subunit